VLPPDTYAPENLPDDHQLRGSNKASLDSTARCRQVSSFPEIYEQDLQPINEAMPLLKPAHVRPCRSPPGKGKRRRYVIPCITPTLTRTFLATQDWAIPEDRSRVSSSTRPGALPSALSIMIVILRLCACGTSTLAVERVHACESCILDRM
jgi:hypothetical protein